MKAIEILNRCRAADAEISRIRQRIEQRNSALYRITASPMDANGGSRASGNHDKIGTLEADIDTLQRQMLARKRAKQVEIAAACALLDYLDAASSDVLYRFYVLGETAAAIAAQVGVDDFRAGVLPADKAEYVAALRREGHTVLMGGDGINDSPALSEADAGIAISDGAAIAREIADITIAADSLWELVQLRQLAMALMNRIQANYRFVIGFNGALIGLGAAGVLPPATSAMLHNLSTLGVSLHSMRALPLPKSGQRF